MSKKIFTIAAVESFTGGAFSAAIVKQPGASAFFKGSLVAYNNSIKEKIGVNTSFGVVNSEVALAMALRGKEYFDVDYCFAFTGNAGPESLDSLFVGQIFIAINQKVYSFYWPNLSRQEIIAKATEFALEKMHQIQNLEVS